MIISSHIPKTAGSSFFRALTEEYGLSLMHDMPGSERTIVAHLAECYRYKTTYKNPPKTLPAILKQRARRSIDRYRLRQELRFIRDHYRIIHGHFPADKYARLFPRSELAIFFREPLQQMISHYLHIRRNIKPLRPGEEKRGSLNFLVNYRKISLADFSAIPRVLLFYDRFVHPYRMDDFSFVGIVEEYEESITLFNQLFGAKLDIFYENARSSNVSLGDLTTSAERIRIEENLLRKRELYKQACQRFQCLTQQFLCKELL